ncbi:hypothetical protein C7974DRAFT_414004 [Boeremia exigua]|uniref:uncharacterized protein n=1 Tax=Boeremia exigua TaxID=749465 RepID=UPI001E8E457B|nr:uncharacterized protein C7974DRAFT_414004 [Boeremia exigua]KAH6625490.1 hypothetical protein C7974DRAFT_414004 [Boeremia exigua]
MSGRSIRFVDTTQTSFGKRKQVSRACDGCHRKKKRCSHVIQEDGIPSGHSVSLSQRHLATSVPREGEAHGTNDRPDQTDMDFDDGNDQVAGIRSSETNIISRDSDVAYLPRSPTRVARFIGDMNPEGVFLTATETETSAHPDGSNRRIIGTWSTEQHSQQGPSGEQRATLPGRLGLLHGFKPAILAAIVPILEQECIQTIPPPVHREALAALYFDKFNPLLPLIKKSAYDAIPAQSPSRLLLDQGICLVASMDPSSSSHLYLSSDAVVSNRRDFGHRMLSALRMSIEMGRVVDKMLLVQLLTLMSLFQEGPDGAENSLSMLGRAVQHLHSLGLHLCMEKDDSYFDHADTLFCCVWFLDRLSAASQSRRVRSRATPPKIYPRMMRGPNHRPGSAASPSCPGTVTPLQLSYGSDCYYYTNVPGADPFEMFDPNFDLTAIDSFFEGNLDLSFPTQ